MLGKGYVCLYDVIGLRLGEWEHPKAVWCVRLAPMASSPQRATT